MGAPVELILARGGGGPEGVCEHIGSMQVFEDIRNVAHVSAVVGTSAGAVAGSVEATGVGAAAAARQFIEKLDIKSQVDEPPGADIPVVGPVIAGAEDGDAILKHAGMISGDKIEQTIRSFLRSRGVSQWNDYGKDGRALFLPTTYDIEQSATEIIPRDLPVNAALDPAAAVRASMSIPLIFQPKAWTDSGGKTHHFWDGGWGGANLPFDQAREYRDSLGAAGSGMRIIPIAIHFDDSPPQFSQDDHFAGIKMLIYGLYRSADARMHELLKDPNIARNSVVLDAPAKVGSMWDLPLDEKLFLIDNGLIRTMQFVVDDPDLSQRIAADRETQERLQHSLSGVRMELARLSYRAHRGETKFSAEQVDLLQARANKLDSRLHDFSVPQRAAVPVPAVAQPNPASRPAVTL